MVQTARKLWFKSNLLKKNTPLFPTFDIVYFSINEVGKYVIHIFVPVLSKIMDFLFMIEQTFVLLWLVILLTMLILVEIFLHFHIMLCMFLDIAETSVEQCETRYKEMVDRNSRDRYPQPMFSSEFIAADCTKVIHHAQVSIS